MVVFYSFGYASIYEKRTVWLCVSIASIGHLYEFVTCFKLHLLLISTGYCNDIWHQKQLSYRLFSCTIRRIFRLKKGPGRFSFPRGGWQSCVGDPGKRARGRTSNGGWYLDVRTNGTRGTYRSMCCSRVVWGRIETNGVINSKNDEQRVVWIGVGWREGGGRIAEKNRIEFVLGKDACKCSGSHDDDDAAAAGSTTTTRRGVRERRAVSGGCCGSWCVCVCVCVCCVHARDGTDDEVRSRRRVSRVAVARRIINDTWRNWFML